MASKPPVIFLMGATATGKTDLAAGLLKKLPVEIISVDSALIYKGMSIGTAKPGAAFLATAPHHLLDIRDPSQPYSTAEFAADVKPLLKKITEKGKIPLLVGGTMLYFRTLLEGLANLPPSDKVVRDAINQEAHSQGWPALHRELMAVDPVTASRLHPNHSQRIQRALEVFRITGKPLSELQQDNQGEHGVEPITQSYNVIQLALIAGNRQLLHSRIAERFEKMLEQGLIDEVKKLLDRGDLSVDLPSIRAVGYRQVWGYLVGEYDYDTMIQKGIAATRQLAKRQLTWLRKWPDLYTLSIDDDSGKLRKGDDITAECLNFLQASPIYYRNGYWYDGLVR